MAIRCCVGGCSATNKTHRLFNIPKNDSLRELWLSFLIPTNNKLSDLSKEQLCMKRVCQKHFDRYQFDNMGNRLKYGYPCLFTEEEILHGIPLRSSVDNIGDHSYCNPTIPDDFNNLTSMEGDHSDTAMSISQNAEPVEITRSICFPSVERESIETLRSGEAVSETMNTTEEAVEFTDKLFNSVNGSRRGAVKGKLRGERRRREKERGAIQPTSQHFVFWQKAKKMIKKIQFIDAKSKKIIKNKEKYLIRALLDGR